MVAVKLQGGLGNQLFQFAIGHSLAEKWRTRLRVDTHFFSITEQSPAFTPRKLHLDEIGINTRQLSRYKFHYLAQSASSHIAPSRIGRLLNALRSRPENYLEEEPRFDETLFNRKRSIYLDGYFQDYRYAQGARNYINAKVCESKRKRISSYKSPEKGSICIHMRRGDYASRGDVYALMGVCGDGYYTEALRRLRAAGLRGHAYVFSDDKEYARQCFQNVPSVKVWESEAEGDLTIAEFLAMTDCSHFVISNSSYSYWAAWLGADKNSLVYCPSPWYKRSDWHAYSPVPPDWIKLARD